MTETKTIENEHETEKGSVQVMNECSKYTNLNVRYDWYFAVFN